MKTRRFEYNPDVLARLDAEREERIRTMMADLLALREARAAGLEREWLAEYWRRRKTEQQA